MAYIGRDTDKISNVEVLDNITFDGSSSYTLQKNSVNFTPSSANTLLVSIDGVVQAGNFTVSGSTIDFGTAVAGTSTCDFILHYGIGLITSVSDGTVTTAKLADSSVSLAKLTATGTKDATTFLRGDNTFAEPSGGGITEADQWRLTSPFYTNTDPISANLERIDDPSAGQLGSGMSVSSGIFSFPSTGIYLVQARCSITNTTGSESVIYLITHATLDNGSNWDEVTRTRASGTNTSYNSYTTNSFVLIDVTDTSNVKVKFSTDSHDSGTAMNGVTDRNETGFLFIRLGDT